MKFFIVLDGKDPKKLLKSFIISYNGLIQTDEKNRLVAVFSSKNWEISQLVSFEWSLDGENSALNVNSKLTPTDQKTYNAMVSICTVALPALAITCLLNAMNVLYQWLLTTSLLLLSVLIGVTFFLHNQATEKLVRYLAIEFGNENIRWRLESDDTRNELKPLMIAGVVFTLLIVVLVHSAISVLILLFSLGLFLIILSGRIHGCSGVSLWKTSLSNIFMFLALLASFPLAYEYALSIFMHFAPYFGPLVTLLFGLLVLFFVGIVLPGNLDTQEKLFGKSFWIGARLEYQQVLEETRNEIHVLKYFGKWLGVNLMVFPCIIAVYADFWCTQPETSGIRYTGLLFPLKIIIIFPLIITMYSWIKRSMRNLFFYAQVKDPTPRTRTFAARIFEELRMRNVKVKSYGSGFINGSVVHPSPFSNREVILISSGAEKKLSSTELRCLILHECGHIANDHFLMRLLKLISQFSILGESLFALSVDMIRVEERADLFAARRIGKDAYSRFLLRVSVMNACATVQSSGPPLMSCFLHPVIPKKARSRGWRGLYEMYKSIYSTFLGGGIVGYLHPSLPRRIKNISNIEY